MHTSLKLSRFSSLILCLMLMFLVSYALAANNQKDKKNDFIFEETSIEKIHKSIKSKKVTCTQIVQGYLDRINAYNGVCVKYGKPDLVTPNGKEIQLHALTPVVNAGQINALSNINIRGKRSETDLIDNNPAFPDALETAAKLDRYFRDTGRLIGPLHCSVAAIKDQFDTFDLRTTDGSLTNFANDRPPQDSAVVAKLRAAGAIIIGKANMGEYASAPRSTYGGQTCNPYATDRETGASSTGSGASVAANLTTFAIAEESLGSVLDPAKKNGIVGIVPTYGLISRDGVWRANILRECVGTHTRSVVDGAYLLDSLVGYDVKDPITAVALGKIPQGGYAKYAKKTSLTGKRIGVIREFAVPLTVADKDSIRVTNNAVAELKAAGAEVFESINLRDIAQFGAIDDEAIPNLTPSIQDAIAEILPQVEPALDKILPPENGFAFPQGIDPLDYLLNIQFDRSLFPAKINIRALNLTPRGDYHEGKFVLNRYLRNRNDENIRNISELSQKTIAIYDGKKTPANEGTTLDTVGQSAHLYRKQAIQQIILKVLVDNNLDALVFPHQTIPPSIIGAPTEPELESRPYRGWNAITDVSGLPAIIIPAGFTEEVYDRDPQDPKKYLPVRQVSLPFGVTFLGRAFDEANLLEIASGYEFSTKHRKPPKDFPELAAHP